MIPSDELSLIDARAILWVMAFGLCFWTLVGYGFYCWAVS